MVLHDMLMPEIDDRVVVDREGPEGKIFPVGKFSNGPFNSSPCWKEKMA